MTQLGKPPEDAALVAPQNLHAEESVLGAMLLSPGACDRVTEILRPEDFYRQTHAKIFAACLALRSEGSPVDAITVGAYLETRGELDDVGGVVRLYELAGLVPATANVAHYAKIVSENAILRSLIMTGGQIAQLGWEGTDPASVLLEKAEEAMFDLVQGREHGAGLVSAAAPLKIVYERLVERSANPQDITGLASGFRTLDDLTGGFHPGNLVVVAARPSMGKSGLALGIAAYVTLHLGLPVALFTLEMTREEVIERVLSLEGLVDAKRIRSGRLDSEGWARVTTAAGRIEAAPLMIDDSGLITMAEIRSKARRQKLRQPDLALVIVDYLQLMTSGVNAENRVQEVSKISRSLKVLAGELGVPVLALSQLSRSVESRHDKRPILSDLRESGSIEQDADLVAFIYRDEYYNPEETDQQGLAEVILAKQRNGPTGTIKLSFVKRFARFSDVALPGMGGTVT